MKGFILGVILTLAVLAAAVYIYFVTGMAPVATAAQAMPFEKMLAHKALHARVEKEMPHESPIQPDEANLAAGAQTYIQHCSVCHGLPDQQQTAIAQGEFPKPPNLFKGKGVTDDEAGETYWKVDNGIRLTGMPAFGKHLSATQMWQVSLLLANASKLPAPVMATLRSATQPTSVPAPANPAAPGK
ncbi:MAG TPA: c-type cytochrome [Terriglobales bacterium]|nr:c-type cytochrome [Terriglobales bacterium]